MTTRILITDDSRSIRMLLRSILSELGNIDEAENGQQAYTMISQAQYDIVLMDIEMPEIDGFKATEQIRKTLGFEQLPIIIITAKNDDEMIKRAFAVGANDYIRKPLSQPEVLARVGHQLKLRQIERNLYQSREQIKRVNQSKTFFISRLSHELRTPLNAILGYVQLLQMDAVDPVQIDYIEQIIKSGDYLVRLIDESNDLSKIEAGAMDMHLEKVDLIRLIDKSVDLISPLAKKNGIALAPVVATEASLSVSADSNRLQQVLVNLLSNAIKYNRPSGQININCRQISPAQTEIAINDTGHGIPPNKLPELFEPFKRFHEGKVNVGGSGIGLTLSKSFIELMGGQISVESEENKGSTFFIRLPNSRD